MDKDQDVTEETFLAFLRRHRGGEIMEEMSDGIRRVVAAVNLTGKGGQLTLKITVKPASRGVGGVILFDSIDDKTPQLDGGNASFWFAGDKGELLTEDPRQQKLNIDVVQMPAAQQRAS